MGKDVRAQTKHGAEIARWQEFVAAMLSLGTGIAAWPHVFSVHRLPPSGHA